MTHKNLLTIIVPLVVSSLLFSSSIDKKPENQANPLTSAKKDVIKDESDKKSGKEDSAKKSNKSEEQKIIAPKTDSYDNNKKDYEAVKLLLESKSNFKKQSNQGSNNSNNQGLPGSSNNQGLPGSGSNQEFNQQAVIESDGSEDLPTPIKSVVIGDSIIVYALYTDPNNKPQSKSLSSAAQDPLIGPIMAENGISTSAPAGVTESSDSKATKLIIRLGQKFNGWTVEKLSSTFVIYENVKLKKHIKKYY